MLQLQCLWYNRDRLAFQFFLYLCSHFNKFKACIHVFPITFVIVCWHIYVANSFLSDMTIASHKLLESSTNLFTLAACGQHCWTVWCLMGRKFLLAVHRKNEYLNYNVLQLWYPHYLQNNPLGLKNSVRCIPLWAQIVIDLLVYMPKTSSVNCL